MASEREEPSVITIHADDASGGDWTGGLVPDGEFLFADEVVRRGLRSDEDDEDFGSDTDAGP